MAMLKAVVLFCALAAGFHYAHGYVAAPVVGYGQGLNLQIIPGESTNDQCNVYGLPTATGIADRAPGPLFLYSPKNTGSHVLSFVYDKSLYNLDPFLAPGESTLQIDDTDRQNPLIAYDATKSNQGQQGAVILYLKDKSDNPVCNIQIQIQIEATLSCIPQYGGVIVPGGQCGGCPSGAGNFIIPSGRVFCPTYVTQIIIQQFTQIFSISITNIIVNVQQITNVLLINRNVVVIPAPVPIVDCNKTPSDPKCAKPPTGGRSPPQIAPAVPPAVPPTNNRTPQIAPQANPPNTGNPGNQTNSVTTLPGRGPTSQPPSTSQTTLPATSQTTLPATSQTTRPATSQTTLPATSQTTLPATSQTTRPATVSQTTQPATVSQTTQPANNNQNQNNNNNQQSRAPSAGRKFF